MEIIIQPTAKDGSAVAAGIVARLLREKPDAVLGLATGRTPLLLYRELVEGKQIALSELTGANGKGGSGSDK